MSSQPRAIPPPATIETPQDVARQLRKLEERLSRCLIAAHQRIWPKDLDGSYTIIQRNGKVKVTLVPPQQKEPGWTDA